MKHLLQPLRLLVPALLLAGFNAQAQAPANDNPSGAITLPLGATCTPLNTTNTGATTTPTTGLGYTNPGCGVAVNPKDVWYTFTTNASGQQGSTAATITVTGNPAGQVRVFRSTGGAAGPFTQVDCSAAAANNTVAPPLQLRGLTPATTYYVAVSGVGSTDTQGAFTICAAIFTLANSDVAVNSVQTLTKLPIPQGAPHVVRAVVTNAGLNAQTNVQATLNVTGANTFTDTQTIATLASGASVTVSFAGFTPTTSGTNTITVTTPADGDNTNNSKTATQLVNTSEYSYSDASMPTSARGFGPSATVVNSFLARYTTSTAINVTQVRAFLVDFVGMGAGSTVGKTVYGVVLDATTGAILGRSADFVVTTASLNTYTPLTLNTPVTIQPGNFLVGIAQTYQAGQTTQYFPIGTQPEIPGRTGAFYTSSISTPATPTDVGVSIASRFMIEAVTTAATPTSCAAVTALSAGTITNTGASISFTAPTGATGYIVTVTPQGGAATTITPAPTASPVVLTGLVAGTTYTVSVTNNCGPGNTSVPVTTTFTTTGGTTTPANDNPSGAIALTVGAACTPVNGTNVGATTTTPAGYTNPGCGVAINPKDVWYSFTTAATGLGSTFVSIQVTGAPAGQVRVFSAASNAGPFTQIGCAAGAANNTVAPAVRVANLTPNTTYYIAVSGVGSTDTQGAFTICAVGLPTPPAPVFATLPYTEGFEGTWVDVFGTRDVPSLNWRNTPTTGDNSWRREDDGFASAGWRYIDNEMPTMAFPIPPYVIRSSTGAHSARFHSFGAEEGEQGSLDLYVNMSGAGNKTLSFDFINPTGADSVVVLVSTNGGTTFGQPVHIARTSATFTTRSVVIPSTSATTVIRFLATSDFGNDDMGIDNVQVRVVTATRDEALAAKVDVYPNPAHRAFTLALPAGKLNSAAAVLYNGLGQVVQQRQLNLPAAGGSATFDVSSLAAGVYSLHLKSGETLVVKRVVVE